MSMLDDRWSVVLTVLPHAVADQQPNPENAIALRASVLCTPKLPPGADIANTPLKNWLTTIRDLTLELEFVGLARRERFVFDPLPTDYDLWTAVFTGVSSARASRPGFLRGPGSVKTRSYSVEEAANRLRMLYQIMMTDAGRGPSIAASVAHQYDRSGLFTSDRTTPDACLEPRSQRQRVKGEGNAVVDFHAALSQPEDRGRAIPNDAPDFNEAVSMIGSHPELQWRLGLVLRGTVSIPTVGLVSEGRVRAFPSHPTVDVTQFVVPWTAYELKEVGAKRVFLPRPRDAAKSRLIHRLVDLTPPKTAARDADEGLAYRTIALDVESGVLQGKSHRDSALTALSIASKKLEAPSVAESPRLRTAGSSLYAARGRCKAFIDAVAAGERRQQKVDAALAAANAKAPAAQDDVYLEDVIRGYCVDVRINGTGRWWPLCPRKTSFIFPKHRGANFEHKDEGIVVPAASAALNDPATVFNLHESLFKWEGWNLAAPRPERALDGAGVCTVAGVTTHVEHRGALPSRRLGDTHEFRLRVVDVAGQKWSAAEADGIAPEGVQLASEPNLLKRFESVLPPVMTVVAAGSDRPRPATAVVLRSVARGNGWEELPFDDHYLIPPRLTVAEAEMHRMLDHWPVNFASWKKLGELEDAIARGDGPELLRRRRIPYIPDLCAAGGWLDVAKADAPALRLDFGVADPKLWEDWRAFRLRVQTSPGGIQQSPFGSEITIRIPPGNVSSITLTSGVEDSSCLNLLALRDWAIEAAHSALGPVIDASDKELRAAAEIDGAIAAGQLPVLGPPATLELVHAVSKPVVAPQWSYPGIEKGVRVTAKRGLEDKRSYLPVNLFVHGQSTGSVSLHASWKEYRDSGNGLQSEDGEARPIRVDVPLDRAAKPSVLADYTLRLDDLPHTWLDTRYRLVTYTPIATSRFKEHFADDPQARDPGYFERSGPPLTVVVPNSARPDSPVPRFALPAYTETPWTGTLAHREQQRGGGGLALYFDPPFFSSGEGEQIGVVIWTGAHAPRGRISSLVSRWGRDPFWLASSVPSRPGWQAERPEVAPWQFDKKLMDNAVTAPLFELHDVQGDEADDAKHVMLIPLDVYWDELERLWRCDVDVKHGDLYFPHVQLSFVRYQKHSVPGAELSPVVNTMFAQLLPDRVVSVKRSFLDPRDLDLEVRGPYPAANGPNNVKVLARMQVAAGPMPTETDWRESTSVPAKELTRGAVANGSVSWTGALDAWREASGHRRVLITESETLAADVTRERIVFAAEYHLFD